MIISVPNPLTGAQLGRQFVLLKLRQHFQPRCLDMSAFLEHGYDQGEAWGLVNRKGDAAMDTEIFPVSRFW